MLAPGQLQELDSSGYEMWETRFQTTVAAVMDKLSLDAHRFVLAAPDDRTKHRTSIDWPGLPLRPVECLGRPRALPLLDWVPTGRGRGSCLQEEYIEWRVVREGEHIVRVEMTTELSDYWRVLAAVNPQRTLKLIEEFARLPVDARDIYGDCDPFDPKTSAEEREEAFAERMLSDDNQSPYNDGRSAITCMAQGTNTLAALVQLVLAASHPRTVRDPWSNRLRCLSCAELVPLLAGGSAQLGRASDPVLVERLARLAFEGRLVALDDPIGVYIQSAEWTRLRTPDGRPISPEWFRFDRGTPASGPADFARWQRVTFEPPRSSDLSVSDLVDVATEEAVSSGAQVADLIQVAVLLRVSEAGVEQVGNIEPSEIADAAGDAAQRCAGIHERLIAFESATR